MIKLASFEFKKIIKTKFFIYMVVALSLFVIGFYAFNYVQAEKRLDSVVQGNEYWLLEYQKNIDENLDRIEAEELDNDTIAGIHGENRFYKDMIKRNTIIQAAHEKQEWTELLNMEIKDEEIWVSQMLGALPMEEGERGTYTKKVNAARNQLILEREVEPIFPIDYSITFYNFEKTDSPETRKSIASTAKKYSASGLYNSYSIFNLFYSVIGVVFFLFLFGSILSKEGLGTDGPIHLLFTQPIKRYKVLVSKFLTVIITTVVLLLVFCGISLLAGTIFDRFGDGNYPILVYGDEYTFSFMNLSTYLIKASLLFFMVLLFSYSLLFLFSILMKRTLTVIGSTLIVIIVGTMLSSDALLQSVAKFNPFTYFSVEQIMNQELAATLADFTISYSSGMVILALSTVLVVVVSYGSSLALYRFK